jgi:WD40 repeat protein
MAIWDREGEAKCVVETGEGGAVRSLAMTRDGGTLATLQGDSIARLWDSKSGAEIAQLKIGDARVSCLEFMPDGAAFVTSQFGSLGVWNARTGAPIRDIQAQPWTIQCLAFSSDGSKLLAGGEGDLFKLWDVAEDWRPSPMANVPRGFEAAAISPDRMTFATGAKDGVVRLWSIDLGEELGQLLSLHGPIHRLAFSADGDFLVTGGDSVVRGREILVWSAGREGIGDR